MPDQSGRSRGRGAVIAWSVVGIALLVNGVAMLGSAAGVDDSLRGAVLALGLVVVLLGGIALARAVQLFRATRLS